ncbi:hypothetical protein BGZ83_010547 [Gryganskiella cystojenkinii]|nr:hypothetical protein BGZ83_010547 [Gryganskiella cystojenkinii]
MSTHISTASPATAVDSTDGWGSIPEVSRPDTTKTAADGILRSRHLNSNDLYEEQQHAQATRKATTDTSRIPTTTTATTSAFNIQHLSVEEARKEEERAAEKIRQKTRPLTKFNTLRRHLEEAIHHDEPGSGLEHSESVNLEPQTVVPVAQSDQGTSNVQIKPAPESQTAIDQTPPSSKEPQPTPAKNSNLITIDPPRLVDAQTTPGDKRFFQGPDDPPPEGDFVYDFLYQHQRGAFFLGTPRFSSKSLLPVDPDEWTNNNFETSVMDISDFEVPDPSWEWVHKSWLVDMTGDVDEDGWEYATTFHGSPWHGNYEMFRSFARRRRWLRLRKRKGKTLGKPVNVPERSYPASISSATWSKLDFSHHLDDPSPFPPMEDESGNNSRGGTSKSHASEGSTKLKVPPPPTKPVDLYKIMKKARSDREKLAYLGQYAVRYPGCMDDLHQRLEKYLNLLDYETSRREFLSILAAYGHRDSLVEGVDQLQFYSDQRMLSSSSSSSLLAGSAPPPRAAATRS